MPVAAVTRLGPAGLPTAILVGGTGVQAPIPYTVLGAGGYSITKIRDLPPDLGGNIVRLVNEVLDISQAQAAYKALTRLLAETLDISEARLTAQPIVRLVNETVRLVEVLITYRPIVRLVNETVRLVEALIAYRPIVRVLGETLDMVEILVPFRLLTRTLAETLNLSEALASARVLAAMVNETVINAEVNTPVRVLVRLLAETVNQIETRVHVTFSGLVRLVAETIDLGETKLSKTVNQITKLISETVNHVEAVVSSRRLIQLLSEAVNHSEALVPFRKLARALSEVVNHVEAKLATRTVSRVRAENVNHVETRVTARLLARLIGETVNPRDLPFSVRKIVRAISEGLELDEVFAFITTIPSLVCAGIRLYALFAGSAQIAPALIGSAALVPAVAGTTNLRTLIDAQLDFEECIDDIAPPPPTELFHVIGNPITTIPVGSFYLVQFGTSGVSTPPVVYSYEYVLPPGLTLDSVSGLLSGVAQPISLTQNIVIVATDHIGRVARSNAFSIRVASPANDFTVVGTPTTSGTTDSLITPFKMTAVGVIDTITWSFDTAHPAPAGITIDSAGVVSGAPAGSADGTYNVRVHAYNATTDTSAYSAMFQMVIRKSGAFQVTAPVPYVQYRGPNNIGPGVTFDAHGQTFYASASSNPDPYGPETYTVPPGTAGPPVPRQIYPARPATSWNCTWRGGRIIGRMPPDVDVGIFASQNAPSDQPYVNSASLLMDAGGVTTGPSLSQTVSGVRIVNAWDAIRFAAYFGNHISPPGAFHNYVERTWVTGACDDAIENDHDQTCTCRDSLFEDFFEFMSCRASGTADHSVLDVITLEDMLLKVHPRTNNMPGNPIGSGTWFNCPYKHDVRSPGWTMKNTILALTGLPTPDPGKIGQWTTFWQKLTDLGGNQLLYLEDLPMPPPNRIGNIPAGFSQATGAAARAIWTAARNGWIAAHPEVYRADTDLL